MITELLTVIAKKSISGLFSIFLYKKKHTEKQYLKS